VGSRRVNVSSSGGVRGPLRQRFEARKEPVLLWVAGRRDVQSAPPPVLPAGADTRLDGAPRHAAAAAGRTGDLNPAGLGVR
jgi:hypothetical protein